MMDRFSNLPDQVAHHILFFLNIPDLARFACVSKRCTDLYLSTPTLVFDGFSHVQLSTCSRRQRLFNCLDRFFFRRGDNKIQYFCVTWLSHDRYDKETRESFAARYLNHDEDAEDGSDDCDETGCFCEDHFRIMSWIHSVVRCNVEDVVLKVSSGSEVAPMLPVSIFLCQSLVSLSVDLSGGLFTAPSSKISSNLKLLELKHGRSEEGFFKWISCCCKCIEQIILEEVSVDNITIESSSLKRFSFTDDSVDALNISCEKLEEIHLKLILESPNKSSLNIFAPRLNYLSWKGNLVKHRNLGNLESLEEAEILLKPKADEIDDLYEVFCSLRRAKILTLNEETIKVLFREGSKPAPLVNVCYLGMRIGSFSDELVPTMASLFRGMPNLCGLRVSSNPPLDDSKSNTSGFDMGYWEKQNLAFIDQLKDVMIALCNGSNGAELARYMLEYAQNLEKIVIIYSPQNSDDMRRMKAGKFPVLKFSSSYRRFLTYYDPNPITCYLCPGVCLLILLDHILYLNLCLL